MATAQGYDTAELVAKDKAHLVHPISNLKQVREQGPLILERGEGVYLWDTDGARYIDGFAGLWNVNVGHGRRELAEVAADQMNELAFVPTFFGLSSPPPIQLATKLAEMFPGDLNHVHFASGGAEANESSLKIARYYWFLKGQPEKIKILSRKQGYHGIAMGALAATGIDAYHQGFGPGVPGYVHLKPPYSYRFNPDDLDEAGFVAMLARDLEETIEREGAGTIAAMIGEPVQGAGGVIVPPDAYWDAIIPILKRHDILLIADEVITGFGRTGQMFGSQTYGFQPDIVSFAKGVTSGYIPLGGTVITDEIFDVMSETDRMFMHGFTYSGHPVACAAGLRNIQIIEDEDLPANAGAMGEYLLDALHEGLDHHPHVGEVRGKGLMLIVELAADKATKAKFDPARNVGGKLQAATRSRGMIVRCNNDGIAISPPLIIDREQCDALASAVIDSVNEVLS